MKFLEDIIITIDTREQNQKRIKAVETWGTAQGAIVEHSKLDLCDYRILGMFRDHEINIGIEAKGLSDFCSCDYEDLKRKLFDSFELYDEVALFIESANYSFLNEGFGKSVIINPAVQDGTANVCNLAQFEGCCSTLPAFCIHVRQLRSEAQFPYTIENLLTYCIHDHDVIKTPKMYLRAYKHTLRSFMTSVQVKKAVYCYPNLFWLCSASEESYKEVFGKKIGSQIYNFIRNPELMTEKWKNNKFLDGTDKIIIPEDNNDNDNDKTTERLVLPPLSSVVISNHQDTLKKSCDTDRGSSSTIPPPPLKTKIPGHVQEKDLKSASSLQSISSPAITLTENDNLFGKTNPDWKVETHKMSARMQLEAYLQSPHTLQECVDAHDNFTSGTIFEHITRMKKEGVVIEFDDKTLVMTK